MALKHTTAPMIWAGDAGISPTESVTYLEQEYNTWSELYQAQPERVHRLIDTEAKKLAQAVVSGAGKLTFTLPSQVVLNSETGAEGTLPDNREYQVGSLLKRYQGSTVFMELRSSLLRLGASFNPPVAVAAGLLRYAVSQSLVQDILPAGHTNFQPSSLDLPDKESGDELLVPYVPDARLAYLPQWVAFDKESRLLLNTLQEAEGYLASLQRCTRILRAVTDLSPYLVVDEQYQQKKYGITSQLIQQGRAMALYITREIIRTINRRAARNNLDRGLSITLPYFDDATLEMRSLEIEVIPTSRIMFIPAFVVLAVRREMAEVNADPQLNPSTRRSLLAQLKILEAEYFRLPSDDKL